MQQRPPRRSILIAAIAIAAAAPLAVRAAVPMVELMLGDAVKVTCPTRLTSVTHGSQLVLTCLPVASDLYRISVPMVARL